MRGCWASGPWSRKVCESRHSTSGEEKKGLGVKFLRPQGRERERVPGAGFPERRSRGAEERKGGRKGFFPDTPGRDGAELASAGKSGETVQSPRGKV